MGIEREGWVPVSREELRYQIAPWLGRKYQQWLADHVREQVHDTGTVLIPKTLYEEYRSRPKMSPLTAEQKQRLGLDRS